MSLALAVLVVVAFAGTLERLRLPTRAAEVFERARGCARVLGDPSLSDDEKEARLQREALRLFALLGVLLGGGILGLALPLAGVWALDVLGLASLGGVLDVLERPDFLVAVTLVGGAAYALVRRRGKG